MRVFDCGSQSATLILLLFDGPSFDTLWLCVSSILLHMQIVHEVNHSIHLRLDSQVLALAGGRTKLEVKPNRLRASNIYVT